MMDIRKYIDHTLLKPEATEGQIAALCDDAIKYGFYSVCINPVFVPLASRRLAGSDVKVCTVAGFPLGANAMKVKAFEAETAVEQGAHEVDMVMNLGFAKAHNWALLEQDIGSVTKAARGAVVKVILECCLLTEEEIISACKCAMNAGADFVKTSTGFSTGGATVNDVRLMKETVRDIIKIKAAGGIRDYETALSMIRAGADRIGTSNGPKILETSINTL